jgi:hypothetical protein
MWAGTSATLAARWLDRCRMLIFTAISMITVTMFMLLAIVDLRVEELRTEAVDDGEPLLIFKY